MTERYSKFLLVHTHTLTVLASLNPTNGINPKAGLLKDTNGNLYGTTSAGGSSFGTVFEVAAGSNALTTLVTFTGSAPYGGLIADKGGNLYGTTQFSVFKVSATTHQLTTLATLNNTSGMAPLDNLVMDSSGNLYGTASQGGTVGDGTVFEVAVGSGVATPLVSFDGTNGDQPRGALTIDSAGNFYGTTALSATIFKISAGTHAFTTLANIPGTIGMAPDCTLLADAAGNLYGTTPTVTLFGGTAFKFDISRNTFTRLLLFDGSSGSASHGGLIADAAGNLYGTAWEDGPNHNGTVFELSNTGFLVPEPAVLCGFLITLTALLRCRRR
jgi:uncharacterized repeat protein (TIGR03803 family)